MNNIGEAVRTRTRLPTRLSYADHIVLLQQDTDIDKATGAINRDLASLKRFCERWKMQINTSKTAYITFSLSNPVLRKNLDTLMGGESLKRDELQKNLGVSLDHDYVSGATSKTWPIVCGSVP
ncbi:hypothetical protein PoB_006644100 [Plakobranchus ocellatus]|uniref:Reverse transcriptase domain-containing protein n=1 Tax=Plakobranchus ocellatus TaxID=259542 RepID=A0AAV4D7B4_9GAST|nr:hypothetical protein PoB_006644100 [Plakobranchus ocellatus]